MSPSPAAESRRVVLLSPGGDFARDLLAELARRDGGVDIHLLYRGVHERLSPQAAWPLRRTLRSLRDHFDPRLRAASGRTVFTGALNGPRMTRDLARLRPDVVVLARCALVAPHLLDIPSTGTVNVHPGLLPWVRGNSPLGNSLLRGVPLGCTAFRVDVGIDTGPLLERRLVPVCGGESLPELRSALYRLWVEMTADLVGSVRAGVPQGVPQGERHPLCRRLGSDTDDIVAGAVARGEPLALLQRWAPCCDGLRLPSDVQASSDAGSPG